MRSPLAVAAITLGVLLSLFPIPSASAQTAAAVEPVRIVCFGDSITKRGYPTELASLLGVTVANAGVAGHTSAQGLARMQKDVLDLHPDIAVIFFGTNDCRMAHEDVQVPPACYEENLIAMVENCERQNIKPVLCTLPPINADVYFQRTPRERFDEAGGLEKVLEAYRAAALRVARTKNLPVVDLNHLLASHPEWMHRDGVHPTTPDGNRLIARFVADKVRPLLGATGTAAAPAPEILYDVVVYGGTSAGLIAAVQTARSGKSVVLVEPGRFIGGMTSGGLGATDIGNKNVIGGLSREFYQRVARHYADDAAWVRETRKEYFKDRSSRTKLEEISGPGASMWTFEPKVAAQIFREMLAEAGVAVRLEHRLATARKQGARLTEFVTGNGAVFRAKMFIDATYEGDLMARAGVSYRVGREANAEFGETLNGIRGSTPKNQLSRGIDPYVVPGDPSSGLIPLVQPGDGGTPGEGDHRVQAYNFRLCFTDFEANRLPLSPPDNYDPARYELAARRAEAIVAAAKEPVLSNFSTLRWMPNRKTDLNNGARISTDFIGENYDYPDGDPATRARIWQAHEDYIRGLWYFLSTSPRIPEGTRRQFQAFGPAKDEFVETGGWSNQLYVREARRMVGDYVMTEHNCRSAAVAEDSVGMAAYGMDSHNCQRVVQGGMVRNEGDVQERELDPYPVSFRAIVPKQAECENLLLPVCVSATHIAYGSIRMEPVFMVLGQSAAMAASLAIDGGTAVQGVDYARLRERLLAAGQVLERPADLAPPKEGEDFRR